MAKVIVRTAQITVATAGTAVPCSATPSKWAHGLKIVALEGNTGVVYIGDSSVDDATGFEMAAGETVNLNELLGTIDPTIDLSTLFVDAATSGDKVALVYFEPGS